MSAIPVRSAPSHRTSSPARRLRVALLFGALAGAGAAGAQDVALSPGDLQSEGSITIEFLAAVDDPVSAGASQVSNQGDVSGDNFTTVATDDPAVGGAADPTVTPLQVLIDLQVSKAESIDPVVAGSGAGNLTHTVTVFNNSSNFATGVTLSEAITTPAGVTVDSVVPSQGSFVDPNWTVGTLAPGGSATLTVTYSVAASAASGTDVICNTATVTGVGQTLVSTGDDADTECTSIARQVDLQVSKVESVDPVVAGSGAGNLTYTITVANAGPSNATGVTLSEVLTLPAGVTVDSTTPSQGSFVDPTWTVGNLASGANATLTVVLTVAASAADGTDVICDTATVTAANETLISTGDDADTECTSIDRQVDLQVSKTESIDPVVAGSGAGNLTYTVTVANAGPSNASGVTLSEVLTLPAGVTVDSVTPSQGSFADPTWTVGNLASGANATLTVVLTVAASAAAGTDVVCDTATVTAANETLVNTGDDADTECTSIAREVDLQVSKTESIDPVPAGSGAGNLTYTVTVANAGPSDASGVTLSEVLTLPAGVTVDSVTPSQGSFADPTWTVGSLASGASATLTVVLTVGPSAAEGTDVICDTATVTGANETLVSTGDDTATECTSIIGQVDLQVSKTESADPVVAGSGAGNLTYTVTVANAGPSNATGVTLSEVLTLPAGVTVDSVTPSQGSFVDPTWTVGSLASGADATLTVVLTVAASAAAGTDVVCDTATVTGADQNLINTGDDSDTECTSVVREVDLQVSKTESADPVVAGSGAGNLTYTVTVANAGPSDASGVTLSEVLTLPAGVTVDSVTPSQGSFADPTWTVGNLASGANATLTVVLTVAASAAEGTDVVCDTATVTAANETLVSTGDDSASECTSIDRQVDLQVSKVESIDPVVAGSGAGNLTYTVTVANAGPSDASGVALSEVLTLPAGVTVDSVTPSQGAFADPTWTVGNLASGANATLTVVLTVDASAAEGTDVVCDTATVTAANETLISTGDDADTECTSITREVDLQVSKTESADPVAAGSGAGNLTYTVTLANAGPSDASGVTLSEVLTLPAGVTVDSVTPSQGAFVDPTWTVGNLANGASATLTVVLTVGPAAAEGTDVICDTATVTGANETLVSTGDDSATECTSIALEADLEITKVDDADPPAAGDPLTYTITVENLGPSDATNVVVTDMLPAGVTYVSDTCGASNVPPPWTGNVGTLAASATVTCDIVVSIDPTPPASISNTATVTSDQVDPDTGNNSDTEDTTLDATPPQVVEVDTITTTADGEVLACESVTVPVTRVLVTFDEPMADPPGDAGADDVTNPANYLLVKSGPDGDIQTDVCGALVGDDVALALDGVTYDDPTRTATLDPTVEPLADGIVRLLVCGSTSVTDAAGNPLDGDGNGTGGDDFSLQFRIDQGNLFLNGHFDCDLDEWTEVEVAATEVEHDPAVDVNGSVESGSARIDNANGENALAITQCVPVTAETTYELSSRLRLAFGPIPPGGPVSYVRSCEFFVAADCVGAPFDDETRARLFPRDPVANGFMSFTDEITTPAGASSALCSLALTTPSGRDFTGHLDAVYMPGPGMMLFADGFEAGDTSGWAAGGN